MLAAIEVYNKPSFSYREESFAILAINAWELLLKARVLQLAGNKVSSILKYERRKKADGTLSEKKYRVKTRSGAHLSVGLFKAYDLLINEYGDTLPPAIRGNLELICEIRDNAVHFINKGFGVSKIVQELGTACLRNYVTALQQWFSIDLSQYNFFLMPLAFVGSPASVEAVSLNAEERKLVEFLKNEMQSQPKGKAGDFNVALRVDVKFSKSKSEDVPKVVVTNDPDATPVTLSEEDLKDKYPWDFRILTTRLKKRYKDFKENKKYHEIRKELEKEDKYCWNRFLDRDKKSGTPKRYYSPNIVKEFDAHYEMQS